jgi:seryl-tRNA synthetase
LITHSVRLKTPIPSLLVEEFLKQLAYVSDALLDYQIGSAERDSVNYRVRPEAENRAEEIADRIVEVGSKLTKVRRPDSLKTLVSRKSVRGEFTGNPHPLLESLGEIHRYGAGRLGFGPRLVELMELFDQDIRTIATKMKAQAYQFPTLIGADLLDRCRYLRSFPASLTMVSHMREDLGAIQDFARTAAWDGGRLTYDPQSLSAVECLLSPSVCFHYYALLNDQVLENSRITALGKCFRFESRNMSGMERLWDFTMREIIFVGQPEYVLASREEAIRQVADLLDHWALSYEIRSASDPFFVDNYAPMATFQLAFELKFEILARLPYAGRELAIGSFNYHQDFFGRTFNISNRAGTVLHTGCAGWGLERVVLAFLAQHGLDPKQWPAGISARVRAW